MVFDILGVLLIGEVVVTSVAVTVLLGMIVDFATACVALLVGLDVEVILDILVKIVMFLNVADVGILSSIAFVIV